MLKLKNAANQHGQRRIVSRIVFESNLLVQSVVCIAVAESSFTKTCSEQLQISSIECQQSDTDTSGEPMDYYTSKAHVAETTTTKELRAEVGRTLYEDELTMVQSQEFREEAQKVGLPECLDAYFTKHTENEINSFFHYHPQQPLTNIPFNPEKAYKRDGFSCHWLINIHILSKEDLFYSVCLAFSKPSDSNPFTLGMNTWKHVYRIIEYHGSYQYHRQSTNAFLLRSTERDISFLLVRDATNIRQGQDIKIAKFWNE